MSIPSSSTRAPNPAPHWRTCGPAVCALEDLQWHGFLNRAELRLLQESGVMVIGSHSMTHTWYPTGPEVIDSHRPDLDTPWLAWNARPERKYAYLPENQSAFVPFDTPIHQHGRSLGIRRYFPGTGRWTIRDRRGDDGEIPARDLRKPEDPARIDRRARSVISAGPEAPTATKAGLWPNRPVTRPFAWRARTGPAGRMMTPAWSGASAARTSSRSWAAAIGPRTPLQLVLACEVELGRSRKRWPSAVAQVRGSGANGIFSPHALKPSR